MERLRLPVAPMVLGAILGPIAEDSFTRSMITFHDDWTVFFGSPISATLMVLALISLAFPKIRELIAKKRKNVSQAAPVEASATTQQLN